MLITHHQRELERGGIKRYFQFLEILFKLPNHPEQAQSWHLVNGLQSHVLLSLS